MAADPSIPRYFRIHAADNVATMLDDVHLGPVSVLGAPASAPLPAPGPIPHGHKIALAAIPAGGQVIKFGIPIGQATRPIAPGEWVHLHNCASGFDQRSQTLELHTGAVTDTKYE